MLYHYARSSIVSPNRRYAKGVSHGRYVAFQMAEVTTDILRLVAELRPPPAHKVLGHSRLGRQSGTISA
jgi:hypothetical protein